MRPETAPSPRRSLMNPPGEPSAAGGRDTCHPRSLASLCLARARLLLLGSCHRTRAGGGVFRCVRSARPPSGGRLHRRRRLRPFSPRRRRAVSARPVALCCDGRWIHVVGSKSWLHRSYCSVNLGGETAFREMHHGCGPKNRCSFAYSGLGL